jgi:hypothetical protein
VSERGAGRGAGGGRDTASPKAPGDTKETEACREERVGGLRGRGGV